MKTRKKTSREHKAAVELAQNRRQLAKALRKEGFDGVPLSKRQSHPEITVPTEERDARMNEKANKDIVRKNRASMLLRRTRKGQPIMKNLVNDLVDRLSNQFNN